MIAADGSTTEALPQLPPPPRGMLNRIRRRLSGGGSRGPIPSTSPATGTTTVGATEVDLQQLATRFFKISKERLDIYDDVKEMESTIPEVESALDILADEAVNAEYGGQKNFEIVFPSDVEVPTSVQNLVMDAVERAGWRKKAYAIARDTLHYGDNFLQNVISTDFQVVRLMYMPPEMMVRNEDRFGLLKMGNTEGEWAFEQYSDPRAMQSFLAGFYPWQMNHLRWNHRGSEKYGKTLLYAARTPWKKLRSMEESLVINWLTRAFVRLLFILDVTDKSEREAEIYIKRFKRRLETRKLSSGVLGVEDMSVVRDIFLAKGYHQRGGEVIPALDDVKTLDTSHTGFTNLSPIEYYRDKLVTSLRVPKAYLGLERDINSKATLYQEDKRFARTIRRVQSLLSMGMQETVTLSLLLAGIRPTEVPYEIRWPNPSRADMLEESRAAHNWARSIEVLLKMKIIDQEHAATNMLHIDANEWNRIFDKVGELTDEQLAAQGTVGFRASGERESGDAIQEY